MDSLGISDELKDKLEDVLIPEQQFTLGRMLGKGLCLEECVVLGAIESVSLLGGFRFNA